jgi:hypothetical protein
LLKASQPEKSTRIIKQDSVRYPKVLSTNQGVKNATKPNRLVYQISQPSSGKIVYSDTMTIGAMNAGDSLWTSCSKPLTFYEAGAYLMTCYAEKSNDGLKMNDTLQYVYFVEEAAGTQESTNQWQVFPNPADNQLTFVCPCSSLGFDVVIFDAHGRQVYSNSFTQSLIQLDTKIFASGFYTVKLQCEKNTVTRSIFLCHP